MRNDRSKQLAVNVKEVDEFCLLQQKELSVSIGIVIGLDMSVDYARV